MKFETVKNRKIEPLPKGFHVKIGADKSDNFRGNTF